MDRQRVQAGIKGKSRYGVGYGRTADPETLFGYRQNRQSCRDPIYDEQQISGAGRGRSPGLILVDPAPALVPRYCRSVPFNEETSTGRVLLSNTCPPPNPPFRSSFPPPAKLDFPRFVLVISYLVISISGRVIFGPIVSFFLSGLLSFLSSFWNSSCKFVEPVRIT